MPISALILIIIAAALHAVWNLAAKQSGGTTIFAFTTAIVTVALWAPVALALCAYQPESSPRLWSLTQWSVVLFSAFIHSFYYTALLKGYSLAPLSIIYPLARGTGPLLASAAALVVFREELTLLSTLGLALITIGILYLSGRAGIGEFKGELRRGVLWGLFTGMLIASYTVVDSYGVKVLHMQPVLFDYWANLLRVALMFPFLMSQLNLVKQTIATNTRTVLIVSLLSPGAYILVLAAVQMAPLSHIAPARELSLLFGAFLGSKYLGEGELRRRLFSAMIIALGVICLALA